ncbi:velvet factor-domain-containing protein [Lipomyces starkeyi]
MIRELHCGPLATLSAISHTLEPFIQPPASIFRALGKFLSAKGPGSGHHGLRRSSSNDRYDDSDSYPIDDCPEPPSAVDHSLVRGTKYKRHPTPSGQPDIPSQPNFSTSTKFRSRIAIENLIERHETSPRPTTVATRHQSSLGPFESRTSVRLPTAVSRRSLRVENYVLKIRRQPLCCIAFGTSEKDRKLVTPAPTIELTIHDGDPHREWLHSPFFFVGANLYDPVLNTPIFRPLEETLVGRLVSSLHRVRNQNGRERAYVVFDDLSIKLEGQFCLQFNLFEMVDGAQFEFITSTLSDVFVVYSSEQFSGVFRASDESAMDRQGVLTAARSETATESSTPSSTTTGQTATTAMPSPTAKRQKIVHKMEMSESDRVEHETQSRRKRSARSNVSTSSFGLAVPPIYSTRTLKRRAASGRRRPARSSSEKRAEATDTDDRKNYYYEGPRRHAFLKLSYSPREQHQYYVPAPPSPPPPPLSTYRQQYEDHYQTTAIGNATRPPHSLSRPWQHQSKSTMQQVGHSRTSFSSASPAYWTSIAPHHKLPSYRLPLPPSMPQFGQQRQPQLQQHARLLSPTGLQLE